MPQWYKKILLLRDCPPVLHLTKRDAKTRPDAIQEPESVGDAKHKRARIEEIRISCASSNPQMVEKREKQKGV